MKSIVIAILSVSIFCLLPLTGCHKEQNAVPASPDSRQTRLTADENHRLKGQLHQSETEISRLNKELEQCRNEKAKAEEDAGKSISFLLEQNKKTNAELQEENANLKEQIQKLENESKNSKGQ